ncbi:MAG: SRPBCC family protein [Archangium sp.]|nr:SRPBCC family protein [Archangium sp.]
MAELPKQPIERAKTWLRWPMWWSMPRCDLSLLETTKHIIDVTQEYDAPPERVQKSFLGFVGEPPWSPGFMGCDWWTPPRELAGAVMDELYVFMSMRVEVLDHTPGSRTVAWVSRWSLPFANKMVQLVETNPREGGGTVMRYRVAYEPPWLVAPLVPLVAGIFKWWFVKSLEGLAAYLKRVPA